MFFFCFFFFSTSITVVFPFYPQVGEVSECKRASAVRAIRSKRLSMMTAKAVPAARKSRAILVGLVALGNKVHGDACPIYIPRIYIPFVTLCDDQRKRAEVEESAKANRRLWVSWASVAYMLFTRVAQTPNAVDELEARREGVTARREVRERAGR